MSYDDIMVMMSSSQTREAVFLNIDSSLLLDEAKKYKITEL